MLLVYAYHEGIQCARITWISDEICRSRCCSQYTFFRIGCEKLLNVVPSANFLCTHLTERINYRITSIAYHPLQTKQILIQLNYKFEIITTKRVIVITRRLSERAFHTRWHQRHKHKIYYILVLRVGSSPRKVIVFDSRIFRVVPFPLEIMSFLDELISIQNQQMGVISRTLTSFKKLGQTKMTRAIMRQHLAIFKETVVRCQELDPVSIRIELD